jgi:SAM-dependent methyltransferase
MADDVRQAASSDVGSYYDARVAGKLADFTHVNPRIEAAIALIGEWAPAQPRRILEIGCGVGATSWRMARAWPDAQVIGSDISGQSIAVASACFQLPNLSYRVGPLAESAGGGEFDLVVMMDVYEHIRPSDRPLLHETIAGLLSADSRFVLTIPTPTLQQWGRDTYPAEMQPVDEDVGLAEIGALADATRTRMLYYRQVGIWRYGDYFHLVLGRFDALSTVAARQPRPEGVAALKHAAKRALGRAQPAEPARRDYLGADVLAPRQSDTAARLQVSAAERRAIAERWKGRSP